MMKGEQNADEGSSSSSAPPPRYPRRACSRKKTHTQDDGDLVLEYDAGMDASSSSKGMSNAELPFLPDDVMLIILSYMNNRKLILCRLVCRRFRDLCLHPFLWRTRSIIGFDDKPMISIVLRIAPCLRAMRVGSDEILENASLARMTRCVVARPRIDVKSLDHLPLVTAFVQLQDALGGLKKLELVFFPGSTRTPRSPALKRLLTAVYSLQDLKELSVRAAFGNFKLPFASCKLEMKALGRALLTKLGYDCSDTLDPFLELLLKTHVATLEEVDLSEGDDNYRQRNWGTSVEFPASLLRMMPRLRSLRCYPHEDLSLLLPCPNLTAISLRRVEEGDFPSGALVFLRYASQLKSVALRLPDSNSMAPLLALAKSRSAASVEALTLTNAGNVPGLLVQLADALHQFPSLQSLDVDTDASDAFLRAVTPSSAPRLTRLTILQHPDKECFHAWLHGPAVQYVLATNPRLHLHPGYYAYVLDKCHCAWCRWGCHTLLNKYRYEKSGFSFSSHVRTEACGKLPTDCISIAPLL